MQVFVREKLITVDHRFSCYKRGAEMEVDNPPRQGRSVVFPSRYAL